MNYNSEIGSKIVYWFYLCCCFFAYITPVKIWMFFGRQLGKAAFHLLKSHRKIAETNIRYTIGENMSDEEISALIKDNFAQFGMVLFDTMRCPGFVYNDYEKQLKNIHYEGLEHLEEAKNTGKGILLLGAHFGMVELANLAYAKTSGRKLNFILRVFDNKYLKDLMIRHNDYFGIKLLYKRRGGLRPALKNLLKGEDLLIFPDQRTNPKESVMATIFGKPSSTMALIPSLAKKMNTPILPMFIFRHDDHVNHTVRFFPPIIPKPDDTLEELAQKQNNAIEKAIRMQPNQWLWLHRRWKADNPKMYK